MDDYRRALKEKFDEAYRIAAEARRRIASPTPEIEVEFAKDLAERVELLVGPKGIAEKIRRLSREMRPERLAFKLAEELVRELRGSLPDEKLILQAMRTSLAVLTPPCITAAPTEGIVDAKIKRNHDGTRYLAIYFAGPIRSAGGTELAAAVLLADFIRKLMNLDRYRPSEEEVRRFIEELRTYQRKVSRFQYTVPEKVLEYILKNLPVEITGVATDKILVPSFRDLPRIETNYLRGGALRVVNDGIAGRAKKVLKLIQELGLSGWDWIKEVVELMENHGDEDGRGYLDELVGGRPFISFSDRFGGLRIRYGRAPATGMAAIGIHPLTLEILEGYLVAGTQLKLDYPGKGGIIVPVDSIEPPVVMLEDGSVLRLDSRELLQEVWDKVVKVLFLGDILISLGDLIENNVKLKRPGYCEEWWAEEVKARLSLVENLSSHEKSLIDHILADPLKNIPRVEDAIKLSISLGIPLHPRYLPFWRNAGLRELERLREWIRDNLRSRTLSSGYAVLPLLDDVKEILTKLLIEHRVSDDKLMIPIKWLKALLAILRPYDPRRLEGEDVLEALEKLSGIPQRDKAGSFIGARMGRPEKAAQREMKPPVNVLFPVGELGGRSRNLLTAAKDSRKPVVELASRRCARCGFKTWMERCPECGSPTQIVGACKSCGAEKLYGGDVICDRCGEPLTYSKKYVVNLGEELYRAARRIMEPVPPRIKGVKGLTSRVKVPEPLEKGILRAKYGLYVYKDGTIRFDSTNAPLTHFTPRQIGTSIEKLRKLGYTHDVDGLPLRSQDQILELKLQDVVIPRKAAEHLLKVSRFIDDLLVKLAGVKPYYELNSPEDLIGELIVMLSPHTYAGVVGRIIGIVDGMLCFAHPIFHAAKRRDCDGDEDSLMLLLDPLINFSKLYLPDRIGGRMDSPLLITILIDPREVDEQAHNLEICDRIPLDFYKAAENEAHISEISWAIPTIKSLLKKSKPIKTSYTHPQ